MNVEAEVRHLRDWIAIQDAIATHGLGSRHWLKSLAFSAPIVGVPRS